mgnify:CR=1 FL=1
MDCTLLALNGCPLSSVSGPMEILSLANSLVDRDKRMNIRIVSESSSQVDCLGGVKLTAHSSINEVAKTDLLIIGAIGNPGLHPIAYKSATLSWIKQHYAQGAQVVSICTGAFLLAETGLLDGKKATTHWAVESLFRKRFPQVLLQSEHIITQDGNLCCSGGASAYQDMSLFIVRQHFGQQAAHQCAKNVLIDPSRYSQRPFASFKTCRQHQDNLIHTLQDWIQENASEAFSIASLAEKVSLSERQLKRRFKQATNETPLAYIQALRIESAKHNLETSNLQIEQISRLSSYEDVRFFRKLFKRYTSLSPSEYREKFRLS